jgi:MFS transporter, FHS family, L-fucose permease
MVHGRVMDVVGSAEAFIVPAVCLAGVALYAVYDLRSSRHTGPLVTEAAAH